MVSYLEADYEVIGLIPIDSIRHFSTAQRYDIINRDMTDGQMICYLCDRVIYDEDLHIDHVVPYSKGGETIVENGRLTHRWCNIMKSDRSFHEKISRQST